MTSLHPPRENVIPGQPPSAQEIQRKLSVAQRKASLYPPFPPLKLHLSYLFVDDDNDRLNRGNRLRGSIVVASRLLIFRLSL